MSKKTTKEIVITAIILYSLFALATALYIKSDFAKDSPAIEAILRISLFVLPFIVIPYLSFEWRPFGHTEPVKKDKTVVPRVETAPKRIFPAAPKWVSNDIKYHGSSDWDNPRSIRQRDDNGMWPKNQNAPAFYLGGGIVYHYVTSLMHAVTIAGSGQGKGVCSILPNLLTEPRCSWFVLDPKGENAKISGRFQKEQGQKVVILDPWNEQKRLGATHGIPASGFNPLDFVKGNMDELPESCAVIAAMLVPDQKGVSDPFWNSRARAIIKTYLMHLLTYRDEEDHHLGELYKLLRLDLHDRKTLWKQMQNNDAIDGIVQNSIGEFSAFGEDSKTLESILATAQDCTTFLESPPLRQSLKKNDFDPYELTNGKTTVYLCLPERFLITHNRWLRLVVGVCLKACNYKPDKRVNFLLDEFAILGKMQDIENAYAFSRGQNISMWVFVQSLTQLKDIYGENGASAFLANARLRQFFGIYDLDTQKYLSEYLGEITFKFSVSSRSESSSSSQSNSRGSGAGTATPTYMNEAIHLSHTVSENTSEGWSKSTTESVTINSSDQYINRRLLTSEEVGRNPNIITFLDDQKFQIERVPYWEDAKEFYPASDAEWQDFYLEQKGEKERRIIVNFDKLKRADIPQIKQGQAFHAK